MGLCPRPDVPGHQETWTFPPTRFGPFLSTRRQDKPKAKRNQDPSPEPHCRAWPPYTLEPQLRPHPKPGESLGSSYNSPAPQASAGGAKPILLNTWPIDCVPRSFRSRLPRRPCLQEPRRSDQRQGPRTSSRGRSRATAAADLEPGAGGLTGLPGFQPA